MILEQPYDFKSLKLVNLPQTINAINRYITIDYTFIQGKEKVKFKPFTNHHTTLNPVILYGLSDVEKDIPVFHHPVINTANNWIAVDLRPFVKPNVNKDGYEVRNESEYQLALQRLVLTGMWFTGKQSSLYSLKLAHFAFATWLSDNLTRKFGLDLNNQMQLKVLGLIYYANLFHNEFGPEELQKLTIRCKEEIIVPGLIEEIYNKAGSLKNIDEFCAACYKVTNNVRLMDLDFVVLSNILATNWFGSQGKELVLLSLEHPPTWLTLVSMSLTQRNYKKSFIATTVDRLNKRGKGEEFLSLYTNVTNEHLKE